MIGLPATRERVAVKEKFKKRLTLICSRLDNLGEVDYVDWSVFDEPEQP
jgi:hypothetical protein